MGDKAIRLPLIVDLRRRYSHDAHAMVIPELDIRGKTRVDVAVVGGWWIHGWEIKSDLDNLRRLPHQVEIYGRVLERATLVVTDRHRAEAMRILPEWWGVEVASLDTHGEVIVDSVRNGRPNRHIDQLMVAGLLWKVEAIQLMRERGMPTKVCRGSIYQIHKRMLADIPFHAIRKRVCRQLRARQGGLRGELTGGGVGG